MSGFASEGAARAADAALCANGAFAALLRLPGPAASGDDAEQLGLATPGFNDVSIGPALWRKAGTITALLVGANAVQRVAGLEGFVSAEALFEAAVGVLADGVVYTIVDCEPLQAGEVPCAYRLMTQAPLRA